MLLPFLHDTSRAGEIAFRMATKGGQQGHTAEASGLVLGEGQSNELAQSYEMLNTGENSRKEIALLPGVGAWTYR